MCEPHEFERTIENAMNARTAMAVAVVLGLIAFLGCLARQAAP